MTRSFSAPLLVLTGSLLGLSAPAHAGRIVSMPADMPHAPEGFGAWQLTNVSVEVPEGSFDPATGAYVMGPEGSYTASVDDGARTTTGIVVGKGWPVGEPAGIKVIHDDLEVKEGRPTNCLMTTSYLEGSYLDAETPAQVLCSSGFQTHKRFKINMLAGALDGVGVDLVFNVEAGEERDYQVFQKINNYTGSRLEGFRVEIGVGVGDSFETASAAGLSEAIGLMQPPEVFEAEKLATFSHGLFGPADMHFPEDGFFDAVQAGFVVELAEYGEGTGIGDAFASTTTMGSHYAQVPPELGPAEQFGPWLPAEWIPHGLFFDDDGDPSTDAQLMAFWGETEADSGHYAWMLGNADGFAPVDAETLAAWMDDPAYEVGEIEDLLNLSLNYIVRLGAVDENWPTWDAEGSTASFTLRFVPIADTSGLGEPGYVSNPPMMGGGDGDGDPGGDGDGDPSGDGDGDPATGDGDGDGDPATGDGDGDGESGTGTTGDLPLDEGEGCSCSSSGPVPSKGLAGFAFGLLAAGLSFGSRRRRRV